MAVKYEGGYARLYVAYSTGIIKKICRKILEISTVLIYAEM